MNQLKVEQNRQKQLKNAKWGGYKIPAVKDKEMRRAAKVDANQKEIVEALRDIGCSVLSLAAVGSGCPDLLVGRRGINFLFEVKDGDKPKSKRKLTPDQVKFHAEWNGKIFIVESVDDAIKIINDNSMYL